jgi:N-acyl-D-amino-acid deacylase
VAPPPEFAGRTLAEYLASRGRADSLGEIVDALIALQASGGFTAVVEAMDPADVEALLQHPAAMVSSDGDLVSPGVGFPHPRSYGAFPRVFAHYVRERGVLTLEDAVARMTTRPAQALGLEDRGAVKVGHVADLVVFDADRIADKARFTDPHHYSEGVVHLFVNGVAVIDDGATTGARPGVPIRRRSSSP